MLRAGSRVVTAHTRAGPSHSARAVSASQKAPAAPGSVAPKASTLRRPSMITGRRREYHSSAPESSSGPSWATMSCTPARRAISRPRPRTARWPATSESPPATDGINASIVTATDRAPSPGTKRRRPATAAAASAPNAKASAAPPSSGRRPSHGGSGFACPTTAVLRLATSVASMTPVMKYEPSLDQASAHASPSAAKTTACAQTRARLRDCRHARAASNARAG